MRGNSSQSNLFGEPDDGGSYQRQPRTVAGESPIHRQGKGEGKVCGGCKVWYPYEEFSWNRNNKLGRLYRSSRCKQCKAKHTRNYYLSDHGRRVGKSNNLKKNYGITMEQYDKMLQEQQGKCAICGDKEMPIDPRTKRAYELAVDHDHTTGAIRALLCPFCNNGLGCFKDDPTRLHAAISYLAKFP